MTSILSRLQAIYEMAEKACAAPWTIDPDDRPDMYWNNHILDADGDAVCFMAWSGDNLNNTPCESAAELIAALRNLIAEVDLREVMRKAERYRWLRDSSADQWEHPLVVSQQRDGDAMHYIGPMTGKELDAAIDRAMDSDHA